MRYLGLLLLVCSTMCSAGWQPEDLLKVRDISDVQLSPSGTQLFYTVRSARVGEQISEYIHEIWVSNSDGSDARCFVKGRNGKLSPDGKWIAFFVDRENKAILCAIPTTGGEATQLTHLETGILDFSWKPDSQAIGFLAPAPASESLLERQARRDDARLIDSERCGADLWVIDLSGQATCILRSSDWLGGSSGATGGFDWSPDGSKIAIARQPTACLNDFTRSRLDLVDVATGDCLPLAQGATAATNPRFSPDGQWIAFSASGPDFPWSFVSSAFIVSASGGDPIPLATTPDEAIGFNGGPLGWLPDGEALVALESRGTITHLYQIPINGSAALPITLEHEGRQGCFSISAPQRVRTSGLLPCVHEDLAHPPEAALIDLGTGQIVRVSQQNTQLSAAEFGRSELITWTSADGVEVEGILTYPLHEEMGGPYPLIVMAHGGPPGVWQQHFLRSGYPTVNPVPALSSCGYACLQPNVRGSRGYGGAFRQANLRDWGGGDVTDLLSGVDCMISKGIADPNRLGIMGWSYGGYLTASAVTQTNRFKAAVAGGSITDLISMAGSCDIPDFIPDYFGGEIWQARDLLVGRSPVYHANRVTTPLLILHGEKDERVPTAQAWELYRAVKRCGCSVELVLYPRSAHVPSEPKLCVDIARRHVEWFDRFLKTEQTQRVVTDVSTSSSYPS
jgi:dipeptidyl aminopeptidase/acylaminoacyl peptidase